MLDYLVLLTDLIRAALRSRRELVAENLLLRQQLAVLTLCHAQTRLRGPSGSAKCAPVSLHKG
jgi:hypothetical protein